MNSIIIKKKLSIILIVLGIIVTTFSGYRFFTNSINSPSVKGISTNISPSEIISLTNLTRIHYNVPTLSPSDQLAKAAQSKAISMIEEGYFDHIDEHGDGPWKYIEDSGYNYHFAGENLARNFYSSQEIVDGWIKSPEHLANLISSQYTQIGVATIEDGDGLIVVQIFASPIDENLSGNIEKKYTSTKLISRSISKSKTSTIITFTIFISGMMSMVVGFGLYQKAKKLQISKSPNLKYWGKK